MFCIFTCWEHFSVIFFLFAIVFLAISFTKPVIHFIYYIPTRFTIYYMDIATAWIPGNFMKSFQNQYLNLILFLQFCIIFNWNQKLSYFSSIGIYHYWFFVLFPFFSFFWRNWWLFCEIWFVNYLDMAGGNTLPIFKYNNNFKLLVLIFNQWFIFGLEFSVIIWIEIYKILWFASDLFIVYFTTRDVYEVFVALEVVCLAKKSDGDAQRSELFWLT